MKLLPTEIFTEGNLIAIRDNVVQTLGAVALRQALLFVAGILITDSAGAGRWIEVAALILMALLVAAYGQLKTWQQKRKALELAAAAPNGIVTGKAAPKQDPAP